MGNKNYVFIIGAGFSYPAGLPIQDLLIDKFLPIDQSNSFLDLDFKKPVDQNSIFLKAYIDVCLFLLKVFYDYNVQEVEKDFENLKLKYYEQGKTINFNDDEIYINLLPIKKKLSQNLKDSISQYHKISIEDIFTILDKTINEKTKIKLYHYTELVNIKNSLLFLIIYYFNLELENFKNFYQNYQDVLTFIEKNKDNIFIITTNWDTLLEKYFIENKIFYDYNFNNPYTNVGYKWKKVENKIPIIKIHGSIDWFICISCNNIQIINPIEINYIFRNDFNAICHTCNEYNKNDELLKLPQIITPTMIKSLKSQIFINLWKNACDLLKNANEIFFIGYSIPIADFEFRYILKKNINNNVKINVILSKNDNPKKYNNQDIIKLLPEYRYKSLFVKNELNFYYEGFTKYFKNKL
ncbi:MAG: SIR2 family protein [Spiroplasma ixodetis]|nr:SIR2 family protein [Spiroplasma ixodetis]MBP1528284.1 SIR2 family protein [Spiroplasma ixodetis]